MAVENSVLCKARSILLFIERLALLDRIFLHNNAWWTIYFFLPTNWFTFMAAFRTTEITAESADYHSEGEYLFLIDRVAAVFMGLSYWNLSCWNIALGLFVLSNLGFSIIFIKQTFDHVRIVSRIGTSNTTETEGEELVKERAEIEDEDEELLQIDKNSDSRSTEEDQEGLETGKVKNFMSCFDQQLVLDVLFNLRLRELMFFMERTPIILYILINRSFPFSFAIFVWYSSLLHLLSLITSQLAVHPTPIRPEYILRIERTAMALSGIYFIYGIHVSFGYLATCLFSLCNAVYIMNLVAPEIARGVVHEIISLCSPTCSSREIIMGEELVKEQAKEEDEDDSDCSEMDDQEDQEAEKRLKIATLLISFEQILAPSVLIYVAGSLASWQSATFFCLFLCLFFLCKHFFPNEPYLLFIDRVSSALLSAFYFTGSICHGGLATGLIFLSDVLFIMNEIRKEEGKEVQKNIDLCSKTCSPKAPNPSEISDHEGEDDPQQGDQEAAEVEENDYCCDPILGKTLMEILYHHEILNQEKKFEETNGYTNSSDNGRKGNDHELQIQTTAAALDNTFWMEMQNKLEGEVLESEVKYNEQLEKQTIDLLKNLKFQIKLELEVKYNGQQTIDLVKNFVNRRVLEKEKSAFTFGYPLHDYELHNQVMLNANLMHYYEENCKKLEEEKSHLLKKLQVADSASEHELGVLHNYERHCRRWEEEREANASKLHAATECSESYRARLRDSEEVCHTLRGQNAELAAKLKIATSSAHLFRQQCWVLEEQIKELTAALSEATTTSDLYRTLLHNV